jgi:hypothetical protein
MARLLKLTLVVSTLVLAVWVTSAGAQEYPPTTIQVGGTVVTRGAGTGTGSSSALPFTGSGSAATYGLIALSLVGVGFILLVSTRRRKHVLDRA